MPVNPTFRGLLHTFAALKPRFSNRGNKRRSVLTLLIPRASARGIERVYSFKKVHGIQTRIIHVFSACHIHEFFKLRFSRQEMGEHDSDFGKSEHVPPFSFFPWNSNIYEFCRL